MSAASTTRILFVGDMHLGRRPSGIPEGVLRSGELGPDEAWRRTVAAAIEHKVRIVALAGDLVHQENAVFEAFGHLQSGISRLIEQGIEVCAVAGNHDTATLPRLAEMIAGFQLLGQGGTWSEIRVAREGAADLRIVGWSFPAAHHASSPLATAPPPADPDGVTFGLLHGDLDVGASRYAPVSSRDLRSLNYEGWFLGHIHKPDVPTSDGSPFYLGSLSPLDPSETDLHGPLLVTLEADGSIRKERLPLAPIRWEHMTLEAGELAATDLDLTSRLLSRIQQVASEREDELGEVDALGIRVLVHGSHPDPAGLERRIQALKPENLQTSHRGTAVFIQKIHSEATGSYDLLSLAGNEDPPGLIARRLLVLEGHTGPIPGIENPASAAAEWIVQARRELEAVDRRPAFNQLVEGTGEWSDGDVGSRLLRAGHRALAELIASREVDHAVD